MENVHPAHEDATCTFTPMPISSSITSGASMPGPGRDDLWNARMLRAAAHLHLHEPQEAADALVEVVDAIAAQDERSGYAVPVGSLVGVIAVDQGDARSAAEWFGYTLAEMERLDLQLRPSDAELVASARARCRDALGDDQYRTLTTAGARAEWGALPTDALSPAGQLGAPRAG